MRSSIRLLPFLLGLFAASCRHAPLDESETSPVGPSVLSAATLQQALTGPVDFHRHIQPLLQQNCVHCHNGKDRPDLVNFTRRESVMTPGPYGPRIVPGKPDQSLIVKNLSLTHAPVKSMPPVGNRLTPDETKILTKWITEGASWPQH